MFEYLWHESFSAWLWLWDKWPKTIIYQYNFCFFGAQMDCLKYHWLIRHVGLFGLVWCWISYSWIDFCLRQYGLDITQHQLEPNPSAKDFYLRSTWSQIKVNVKTAADKWLLHSNSSLCLIFSFRKINVLESFFSFKQFGVEVLNRENVPRLKYSDSSVPPLLCPLILDQERFKVWWE